MTPPTSRPTQTTPPASTPPASSPTQTTPPASSPTQTTPPASSPTQGVELSADVLRRVAKQRVFFGHQSVGANVLEGIPGLYQDYDLPDPVINDGMPLPTGSFGNVLIGRNEDPVSKLDELEGWLRNRGLGDGADVVLMKLCYIDIWRNTDVPAWFSRYRSTMQELERDFPQVTFLHATTPVTTWTAEDNVARERLNALMRAEYGPTGRLFDIARIESTDPVDGTRVSGTFNGETYYELYPGYTTDGGHLNTAGQKATATALLETIAANTQ